MRGALGGYFTRISATNITVATMTTIAPITIVGMYACGTRLSAFTVKRRTVESTTVNVGGTRFDDDASSRERIRS